MDISSPILSFVAKQRLHVECVFNIYDSDGHPIDVQNTFFDVPKDDLVSLSLIASFDD